MAERKFRITNVSGARGKVRTPIPFGAGSSLPPGTGPGRRRRPVKRGRHVAVVPEGVLKPLKGFIRRGQLKVEPLDGKPLPGWMTGEEEKPPKVVKVVEEAPPKVEEPEVVEEAPEPEPEVEPEVEEEPVEFIMTAENILEMNASDAIAKIKEIENEDLLTELESLEFEGKSRKTVMAAIEAQFGEEDEGE